MSENTVEFGLRSCHYAPFDVENGVITFSTPVPWPGAVELKLDTKGEIIEFPADDMVYYSCLDNQGYDGSLTYALMPQSFATDILGEEIDPVSGVQIETAAAKPKPFAFLFEFDGDVKATRHVLFNCIANRPKIGSKTKGDKTEPNTNELAFISRPRPAADKRVKAKTNGGTSQTVYDSWYTTVFNGTPDTTAPTATTVPLNNATAVVVSSNVVFTFSKAIRSSSAIAANFFLMKNDGTIVPTTVSIDSTNKIVTVHPTSALSAASTYIGVATENVKDLAGNALAAKVTTKFTTA